MTWSQSRRHGRYGEFNSPDRASDRMISLDQIDRRLLAILQQDATVPIAELAERVGLSQTPCWKRVKRLQDSGVITARVALIDRDALDLPLTVFVAVKTGRHDEDWLATFAAGAKALPEVIEFYRMSGEVDYLLKVVVRDIAAYDRFYRRLIATAPLTDVSSSFAMEQIKFTTALPISMG
ncbi:Lrp/AsnC family transcriptional regulator [Caulobacter sp. BE254]|uniref:Lrp/AsnC family transcriptional regulator n=1 Tax=Caulobacter sp. BE254 TaxID=2817720 RepID=UPI003857EAF8